MLWEQLSEWCWLLEIYQGFSETLYMIKFCNCSVISVCFLWERKISGVKFCVYLLCVCLVAQSCLTLCHPMNDSPPGSIVLGISQARILEWVDISFSRGSSRSSNWTRISCGSCIGRQILYHWDTWEAQEVIQGYIYPKPKYIVIFNLRNCTEIKVFLWIFLLSHPVSKWLFTLKLK